MPNWCENTLTVSCAHENKSILAKFKKRARNDGDNMDLSMDNFIPLPDHLRKNGGWYQWCIDNWGTKWDVTDVKLISKTKTELVYKFDTAWSPPQEFIDKVVAMYPKLSFQLEFVETGVGFCGTYYGSEGECYGEFNDCFTCTVKCPYIVEDDENDD